MMQITNKETIITLETQDIKKFELIRVRFGKMHMNTIRINLEDRTDEDVAYLIKALGCQLDKSCTVVITLKETK